mmetsp:Transcript_2281/g.4760  ORF Transcript_2281/g.4760 Transcript_2281/m.4760 type:complete len:263 (-) Transcript_2281:92-880(-)
MGTGASSGLQAAIKETSNDDLAAVLGSLTPELRAKLRTALSGEAAAPDSAQLPESVMKALEEQFDLFDIDKNGVIELEESLLCFRELAEARGIDYDQAHAEESFQKMDIRKCGEVNKADFIVHYRELFASKLDSPGAEAMIERKISSMNKILQRRTDVPSPIAALLKEMFDIFDADHDHFLTLEEDKKMMLAMDIELDVDSLKEYQLCPHDGKVSVVEMMEYFHDAKLMDWMEEKGEEWTVNHLKGILKGLKERAPSKARAG